MSQDRLAHVTKKLSQSGVDIQCKTSCLYDVERKFPPEWGYPIWHTHALRVGDMERVEFFMVAPDEGDNSDIALDDIEVCKIYILHVCQ